MGVVMKGLEFRGRSVRLHFTYQRKRCRETLHLDPTKPAQLRLAVRLLADIVAQIRAGVFDYSKTFPNSQRSKARGQSASDFASIAAEYLAGKGELARGTRKKYKQSCQLLDSAVERTGSSPDRLSDA